MRSVNREPCSQSLGKKSHWGDCQSKGGTKKGLQTSDMLVANKRRDFVNNTGSNCFVSMTILILFKQDPLAPWAGLRRAVRPSWGCPPPPEGEAVGGEAIPCSCSADECQKLALFGEPWRGKMRHLHSGSNTLGSRLDAR